MTDPTLNDLDDDTLVRLESAAFRRLLAHLRERSDVQNIDLMTLAGFCRNCLSNWLQDAAQDRSLTVSRDQAREHVYGMPFAEWKRRYQREATAEQTAAFAGAHAHGSEPTAGSGQSKSP